MEAMEILGSKMDTFWTPNDSLKEENKNAYLPNFSDDSNSFLQSGRVAEWLMALVLKTSVAERLS